MKVRIHTAGVAQGNPQPGGYAAVLWLVGDPVVVHGNSSATDEEEMGLRAIVEGITNAWNIFGNETPEMSIEVHSSSPSVMDAARAAAQNPGGNEEKIRQELAQVTEGVRVSFVHDDHEENGARPEDRRPLGGRSRPRKGTGETTDLHNPTRLGRPRCGAGMDVETSSHLGGQPALLMAGDTT